MWTWTAPDAAAILQALVAALPDAAFVTAAEGFVIAANDAARTLLDTEVVGRHVSAVIRAPALLDAVQRATSGETAAVGFETRRPALRAFAAHVAPIPGPAVLVVMKDLTREQQIERMRADFVANASHELRTPLASLFGFVETMQGAARSDAAARDRFLQLMKTQAERMKRLIDDLLSLSRIEMNEHVRPADAVDLAKVAAYVRDTLAGMAKEQGVPLSLAIGEPLRVAGDWDQLVQVVQNLTENALKYGGGAPVAILGRRDRGFVELAVKDDGPGIAAEHLPRLTERFYRVNPQDSRAKGGTGLGLAIVKHILNRHRGRLVIASELGKGSTFTLRIPEMP